MRPPFRIDTLLHAGQLLDLEAPTIFGAGILGAELFRRLSDHQKSSAIFIDSVKQGQYEGRPILSLADFIQSPRAKGPVLLATDAFEVKAALRGCGIAHLLDPTMMVASERTYAGAYPRRKIGVFATVPRSGTVRTMYFLFALNELLENPRQWPDPYKLSAYFGGAWQEKGNFPALNAVLSLLGLERLDVMHCLAPGACASASHDQSMRGMLDQRHAWFDEACREHPQVSAISLGRDFFEPALSSTFRCFFVARDLEEQIVSYLTVLESFIPQLQKLGVDDLSLGDIAEYCRNGDMTAFSLFHMNGRVPIYLYQALKEGRYFTEVAFERGGVDSLVLDYLMQCYSFNAMRSDRFLIDQLNFSDLMADEVKSYMRMLSHLAGKEISSEISPIVERAVLITGRVGIRMLEESLGRSASYSQGNTLPIHTVGGSHMTQEGAADAGKALRSKVTELVRRNREVIRSAVEFNRTRFALPQVGRS
ncbi:MAG TPA: hypothetical protein VEB20_05270 [Azospirillaceae bacterium]|nr:hypothetical protein [Azospirillaceae bacterium]